MLFLTDVNSSLLYLCTHTLGRMLFKAAFLIFQHKIVMSLLEFVDTR